MPRYSITAEYDGTAFVGWQVQAEGASVQGVLATAIEAFSGDKCSVRGAGRTDSGVHALGQVAHFDLSKDWDPFRVSEAINFHVRPHGVCILNCHRVPSTFDARFSAVQRHYLYRLLTRRAQPVLDVNRVWWLTHPLDACSMQEAAKVFVGHHDFTTFRAAQCQANSPLRTIDSFNVSQQGDEIRIEISARSFLHNQVRSMVGSLKLVGEGKWTPADVKAALSARDRKACGPVAPACGLYLARVDY
ncbi:MAG: tRNA pseudouridine(38-40) synthase TruA [Hyphomicrobium sp.]